MPTSTPTARKSPPPTRRPWWQSPIVIIIAASVLLLALGIAVAQTVAPPATRPAAAPPPVEYRPLAGAGSATTQPVLDALSEQIPEIASYGAAPAGTITTKSESDNPDCTLQRPASDVAGIEALIVQQGLSAQAGTMPCLDFARSTVDISGLPGLADAGLTFIPFGIDGVTFAQRDNSTNPRALSRADLAAIFSCTSPNQSSYLPLLPAFGSGLRRAFLTAIGLADDPNLTGGGSCITQEGSGTEPENFGRALTDPRHIAPYSVAQYLAQNSGVTDDGHGTAVLGQVDGVAPTVASGPDAVGVVRRTDSPNGRLTVDQLAKLYTCAESPVFQAGFRPLLPAPGSPVRAAFLTSIGLTDSTDFVTIHPCVSQTDANGAPVADNVGTALVDPRNIAPYSIEQHLAQVNGLVEDQRGATVLMQVEGLGAPVLNPAFPLVHDVYTVVPTGRLDTEPVKPAFVGPTSAVCSHPETIVRFGFAVAPNCGDTTVRTPL